MCVGRSDKEDGERLLVGNDSWEWLDGIEKVMGLRSRKHAAFDYVPDFSHERGQNLE